jgi:hypothetical protein
MREQKPFKSTGTPPPKPLITSVQRRGTLLLFAGDPTAREGAARQPRQVRVLPLPDHCHHHLLHQLWDICFELHLEDDLAMWWPCDPQKPPDPSHN